MNIVGKDCWDLILDFKYRLEFHEKYKEVLEEFKYCIDSVKSSLSIIISTYKGKPLHKYYLTNGRIESRDRGYWPDRLWNDFNYVYDDDLFSKMEYKFNPSSALYAYDFHLANDLWTQKSFDIRRFKVYPPNEKLIDEEIIYLSNDRY